MSTVWGVTSFDLGGNAGHVVHCLFTTEKEARKYAAQDSEYQVEEFTLYEQAPEPYVYFERIAEVYPDGHVEECSREQQAQPPGVMPELDDHLAPFDGHMQGHCGEHIYVSGTDKELVEQAFQRELAESLARQDGVCHSRFGKHEGDIDGVNIYTAGSWGTVRRKGSADSEKLICRNSFEHDWGDWSEWKEIDQPGQFNRQRVCKRCTAFTIACSSNPESAVAAMVQPL